jgi:hypothetical protein
MMDRAIAATAETYIYGSDNMADMDDYDEPMENIADVPPTAQELDELLQDIDEGEGTFAELTDDQREQLKEELCEEWLATYLDDYPVPNNLREAVDEYREIESGDRFPNLPENVRNELLLQFDDQFGEGGPDNWSSAEEE